LSATILGFNLRYPRLTGTTSTSFAGRSVDENATNIVEYVVDCFRAIRCKAHWRLSRPDIQIHPRQSLHAYRRTDPWSIISV